MSSSSDESVGFEPAVLEAAAERIETRLEEGEVASGRRRFFEGLRALQSDRPEEATRNFRRAARNADPPFDALSRVARGECERVRGNTGVALREWRRVAESDTAPKPARYMAWLSIAAAAESRSDEELLERARSAIDELETSEAT